MERSRIYECMCLLDNREVRKGWDSLKGTVAAIFAKHGAEVMSSRRWDECRLGYPVRGQLRGTYLLIYFKADTQALTAIRRDMQFSEPVMRFLTTVCEEVPETAYEPEAEFDVNAIPDEEAPATEEAAPEAKTDVEAKADGEAKTDGEAKAGAGASGEEKPAGEGAADEGSSDAAASTESSEPEAKTEA